MIRQAFRNIARGKVFAAINILGLAAGLATCLMIMLYIADEANYDRHQENAGQVYRVAARVKEGEWAAQPGPVAAAMKQYLPEVEQAVRLLKFPEQEQMLLKTAGQAFSETEGFYADAGLFDVLTYDFTAGHPATALSEPNSLVLSAEIATKLFGREDPLGKVVTVGLTFGEFPYTVRGVFDPGSNKSHIPARFFLSMKNGDAGTWVERQANWATNSIFHTYIKLRGGTDAGAFAQKLKPFMDRHAGPDLKAAGFEKDLFLQPLPDIYLHSNIGNELAPTGSITYLYILGSIAAFILIIACINFMNLSTARSEKRAREVGVRKVMGAGKAALVRQFLGESFIMCFIALLAAAAIVAALMPLFNEVTQKEIAVFNRPELIAGIVLLTVVTGLLAGTYPAFYLSSFRPAAVLKGKTISTLSATGIRKGLVIFQFTISICLVLGAFVILQQLRFMQKQHLGFNAQSQIVLPLRSGETINNYQVLKDDLLKQPFVRSVSSGSAYPGMNGLLNSMLFYTGTRSAQEKVDISLATVGDEYFRTLDLKLIAGRPFSKEFKADSAGLVLNETAAASLGYTAAGAVGRKVHYDWQGQQTTLEIIGIVKDFHFESLHHPIKPFGFTSAVFGNKYSFVIVNFNAPDYAGVIAGLERSWKRVNPGVPFDYSFLDQDIRRNYDRDQRTSQIVVYFTVVAILIACLGLFGLAAFSAEQRVREISIRKVLGASVPDITVLISRDFLRLVIVAIVIAVPLALWGMNEWLQNFAYRIPLEWWMFLAAGLLALLIAFLTVSTQAIRAALTNPVNGLRGR